MQRICCLFLDKIIKLGAREMDEWIKVDQLNKDLSSDPGYIKS